jgi:REP element-mobilizing transposase RayT
MVHGYHATFGAYGFWLPNDPRGSGSSYVGQDELFCMFGPATLVEDRNRSRAGVEHDHAVREAAKSLLLRPPITFSEAQRRVVGDGFATSISKGRVMVWACAVMPDHAHVVFARHQVDAEQIVNFMKGSATRALVEVGLHPFLAERAEDEKIPRCWAERQWIVYLNSVADIQRSIEYVEENPLKAGLPRQMWPFVLPFDPMVL